MVFGVRRRLFLYDAGYSPGPGKTVAESGLKAGDTAFVWGLKAQRRACGQRTIGILDALNKAGLKVIYQEIDDATNAKSIRRRADLHRHHVRSPGNKDGHHRSRRHNGHHCDLPASCRQETW